MVDRFARWTTEGQLATVVMAIVFFTWLGFQIWVPALERPSVLNEVLLAVLGAWITNMSYGMKKREAREEARQKAIEAAEIERRVEEKVNEKLASRVGRHQRVDIP